jgi:hypothetical protein
MPMSFPLQASGSSSRTSSHVFTWNVMGAPSRSWGLGAGPSGLNVPERVCVCVWVCVGGGGRKHAGRCQ